MGGRAGPIVRIYQYKNTVSSFKKLAAGQQLRVFSGGSRVRLRIQSLYPQLHPTTATELIFERRLTCLFFRRRYCRFLKQRIITSDNGGGKCDCRHLSVCLSVCLLARLLKNAWMDLNEMLRVDRCPDMDELINF